MSDLRIFTIDELEAIIVKHQAWLNDDDDGERANLSNANLSYANLRYADLRYANLSSANLSNANLSYANLRYADLRYANLRYANLSNANLSSANLRYADLRYADLRYANLSNANLSSANLILIGQDIRDYLFYGFKNDDDALVIRAGCRQFVGITAARQHWTERHTDDNILHEDCLSLVDRAERMAKVRGWKLEPEA